MTKVKVAEAIEKLGEYPLPERELIQIVSTIKPFLDSVAHRVEQMKVLGLSPEEHRKAEDFIFYYNELLENNISPISLGLFHGQRVCRLDFCIGGTSWAWQELDGQRIPHYDGNNFFTLFWKQRLGRSLFNSDLDKMIKDYIPIIKERNEKDELIGGDLEFVESSFKRYLRSIKLESLNPSEEWMEKQKAELDDLNILKYVNWHGQVITVRKTQFQAWEEFKGENPKLVGRLVELCNLPREVIQQKYPEFISYLSKAFTLMRTKGFDVYPLHR